MKVSVFTPSHNTQYLQEAYESLLHQTFNDWEWVLVLNGQARASSLSRELLGDERIKIVTYSEPDTGVGRMKRIAVSMCDGEILVELDHDDFLAANCLMEVVAAFDKHPKCGFVYSDDIRFTDSNEPPVQFNQMYGWPKGQLVGVPRIGHMPATGLYVPSFEANPQSLARIWYAPDHVRAWRRETYLAVGGYDETLDTCDDYDLLLRTYIATPFYHIRKPMYFYRQHPENTSAEGGEHNALIQAKQFEIGNKYRVEIAETWAVRSGLAMIDLCSAGNVKDGYIGYDIAARSSDEILCDLNKAWPIDSESVGVIRAQDAIEHLIDKQHTMNEAWHVLVHGGWFFVDVPSTDGRGAFQDPTHVSFWNSNSFWYWTCEAQRKYLPGYPHVPHFQMWQAADVFYSDWYKQHNIVYSRAHMSAVKGGPRLAGPYDYAPGSL